MTQNSLFIIDDQSAMSLFRQDLCVFSAFLLLLWVSSILNMIYVHSQFNPFNLFSQSVSSSHLAVARTILFLPHKMSQQYRLSRFIHFVHQFYLPSLLVRCVLVRFGAEESLCASKCICHTHGALQDIETMLMVQNVNVTHTNTNKYPQHIGIGKYNFVDFIRTVECVHVVGGPILSSIIT